jgi:hypothetical protein
VKELLIMNKKLNLLVMLVSLLALGSVLIGCPTDSDDGGGGGYSVSEKYRGVYTARSTDDYDWTLTVKESTLEIVKVADGRVKTLTVDNIDERTTAYIIGVPPENKSEGGGHLTFFLNDDGTIKSIGTNGNGPFFNYPNDTDQPVYEIPTQWRIGTGN